MANKDKLSKSINNRINKLAKGIQDNLDTIYKSTYYSPPIMSKELQALSKKINNNLDRITDRNLQMNGYSNISKLYDRIPKNLSQGNIVDNLQQLFEDPIAMEDLYSSFTNTKFLRELDAEIDTICKYMPSLAEALEVKKDNVLSADYFSKDFLTIRSSEIDNGFMDSFNERCKNLKEVYNLLNLIEDVYSKAAKYGECFVYCVPYKTAIAKLLTNKQYMQPPNTGDIKYGLNRESSSLTESYTISIDSKNFSIINKDNRKVMSEATGTYFTGMYEGRSYNKPKIESLLQNDEKIDIQIELCKSGIIESFIHNNTVAYNKRDQLIKENSLTESFMQSINESKGIVNEEKNSKNPEAKGNLSMGKIDDIIYSQDGLIGQYKNKDKEEIKEVKVPGCVVKTLQRDQVIPIYIDDLCMGYYYIEATPVDYDDQLRQFDSTLGNPMSSNLKSGERTFDSMANPIRQDELIRFIAGQLSSFIDKNFVNNNQDLRKELYMILKYNDIFNTTNVEKIKVTYVAPDDIVHVYFRQDEKTKRGISDLDQALIPATIYCSVYLTDAIGTITRGQDKRVYYVKQNVEQNIAKTMLTTIGQIKQANFGARQFQNINNVLNISGRFNDYVIPVGPSGDYPIQFEVMQGQQFDPHTDLLEKLEDMAINSTDVPKEIINSRRSIDYAMQLSMSSSKFLRYLYNRQSRYQKFIQMIISKIYNCEYNDNIIIDATLPPPSFLNITNTTQLIDNTVNFVSNIVDNDMPNEKDEVKAIAKQLMFRHYIGTHIDTTLHQSIYDKARMKAKEQGIGDEDNNNGGY